MLLLLVALAVAVTALATARRDPADAAGGWPWFAGWTGAGALLSFSVVTGFTIGMFLVPLVLAALWTVARRARLWPEGLGLIAGVAATCLVVVLLNLDYQPCPPSGSATLAPGTQATGSCGGFDPVGWAVASVALASASAFAYVSAHR
ncbi:hypothetical protein BH20ACT7_BH20ACT7_04380 [soil metagenome]